MRYTDEELFGMDRKHYEVFITTVKMTPDSVHPESLLHTANSNIEVQVDSIEERRVLCSDTIELIKRNTRFYKVQETMEQIKNLLKDNE